jgi:hypothetical protein
MNHIPKSLNLPLLLLNDILELSYCLRLFTVRSKHHMRYINILSIRGSKSGRMALRGDFEESVGSGC